MLETFWLYLDRFTIVIAIFSAVFAWWAWFRSTELLRANRRAAEKRRAPITIRLVTSIDGQRESLELPFKPRRDQLSRGELVGILGLYFGKDRFDADMLRPILENGLLNRVLEGALEESTSDESLEIEVPLSSFQQFKQKISPYSSVVNPQSCESGI